MEEEVCEGHVRSMGDTTFQSRSAWISWVNWEGRASSLHWPSSSSLQLVILQDLYKLETSMCKELIWDRKIILLASHQTTVDSNTSESLGKWVRFELVTYGEKFHMWPTLPGERCIALSSLWSLGNSYISVSTAYALSAKGTKIEKVYGRKTLF